MGIVVASRSMSTVETFQVDVAGGVIAGSKAGSGPNVVLMHGGPGLSDYLATDPLRDELTSGYTVITFQQRGLAPSTTVGPFSVETHVDDAAAVLHAVAPEGAVVVGHSWGGYLVLHLAATRPELISGVVAVDGVGVLGDGGISDVSRLLDERLTPTARATGRIGGTSDRQRSECRRRARSAVSHLGRPLRRSRHRPGDGSNEDVPRVQC